ncbi:reverse transcriptase [Gossypium australe]|uniref:Reverse transcriptase n=1 Tax=Gossypium australe TaxID=47621 RepID=A0A5B6VK27_9ROSI|nr:reverse transcriptase [Gossypium australe]
MFEANWCLDQSFAGVVQQAWSGRNDNAVDKLAQAEGGVFRVHVNNGKNEQGWRNDCFISMIQDPIDKNLEEILEVQLGLNLEADKDEIFWEQRAKINWLKHGDRNTSFFHRSAISRHARNRITGFESAEGRWVSRPDVMLTKAVKFFGELYTASDLFGEHRLLDLVEERVTPAMNDELLKPFLEDEIWQAVKSMAPIKAPGIDGFPALFFQKYWDVIGSDISRYCLAVLEGEIEMGEINKTHIVLIPKVDRPKALSQFQPISLCNVIYKIIAKVMVNRMSHILGHCIDVAQGLSFLGDKFLTIL